MDLSIYKMEKMVRNEELFCIDNPALLRTLLHRCIGAITFKTSKQTCCGSGALISPYLILTAAHNLYDKQQAKENVEFKIYFGANGKISTFSVLSAWRYPVEFKTCSKKDNLQWDYALLKLKQPIVFNSFLPVYQPCPACLLLNNDNIWLDIFGFPHTKQNYKAQDKRDNEIWLQQFGQCRKGRINQVEPSCFKIVYEITTLEGQSGCPVVADEKIIAVHSGSYKGIKEGDYNIGRLVTSDLIANLRKWSYQLGQPISTQKWTCQHMALSSGQYQPSSKVYVSPETALIHNGEGLASIDLGRYLNLVQLSLASNKLTQISLVGLVHLTTLTLYQNLLTEIDLSGNKELTYLNLAENNFEFIDITSNIHLNYLDLQLNKLNLICLWISDRIPALDYLKKYLFCSQRSPNCELQIIHRKTNKQRCGQVISLWKKHYEQFGKKNVNEHNCRYSYIPIACD